MKNLPNDYKKRCVEAIQNNSFKFTSNKAQAVSLQINPAQFSRIINGEFEGVLSDAKWNEIGSKYNVPLDATDFEWQTAYTTVYDYINKQLSGCQEMSISGIFCDLSDIGKTFTAKDYVSRHRNAIRVDCSRHKSRTELLRAIAREFGIDSGLSVRLLQKDLIQYMRSMTKPLVILDEFGDLSYPAFLEVKALWNATEYRCGWYMMGADGLQVKIDRQKDNKKVGYAEIFSRLGSRYQRITPLGEQERKRFFMAEIAKILKANGSAFSPTQMYAKTLGSLRRVYIEIKKEKTQVKQVQA